MFEEVNIQSHLSELGLKQEEIDKLKTEDAIQYIRFYHWKELATSSIHFVGFSDGETELLTAKALSCLLTVKNKLYGNLNFICFSENASEVKIEKRGKYTTIALTKNEFDLIFDNSEYNLLDCPSLYDQSISKELRIAKPLSNFDRNVEVSSFSSSNENVYSANLYQMTCTCREFEKKKRSQYLKGDIRRLCKHLIELYKNNFGSNGLSELNKFIIESGYAVNKHFKYFTIEKIPFDVVVNYESKDDDWWNIFMANEKGVYYRYGYSPSEKRFSYDDKPRGFVLELRKKLNELKYQLATNDNHGFINGPVKKGCAYFGMAILLIFAAIILLILGIILYNIFR